MNRQLIAILHHFHDPFHLREAELRRNPLAVEVHGQGDQTDVTGTLTVAEQTAFYAVGAGHHRQLRAGNAGPPVIMRMNANADIGPAGEMAAEKLNLVSVNVRGTDLDGGWQVDNHRSLCAGLPDIRYRFADSQGKFRFGKAEGCRGVFILPAGLRLLFTLLANQASGAGCQLNDLRFIHPENQLAEQRGGGVVQMDSGAMGAAQRFKGSQDKIFSRLGQHLDGDIFWNAPFLNQLADEVEVGLRCRGEGDFNPFKSALQQQIPELQLTCAVHRFGQRLVAIAQVG